MSSKKRNKKGTRNTPNADTPSGGGAPENAGREGGGNESAGVESGTTIQTPDTAGMTSIPIGTPMSREDLAALKKRAEKSDKETSLPPPDDE